MKKITLFALAAFLMFSCKTEKVVVKDTKIVQAEAAAAKVAATASSDSCNCMTSAQYQTQFNAGHCSNSIIESFVPPVSVTKTVTWNNCSTNPNVTDPNCNVQYGNVTTQLKLCWHSCYSVSAQFIGLPPCLPCYPSGFCMVLTPSTSGGYEVLQGTSTFWDQVTIKIQISTDPDVVIQCSSKDAAGNTTVYTCYGSY
ncbi:MAG: hypothetical protein ACYDCN_09280 [Bacteroidia bacterium]